MPPKHQPRGDNQEITSDDSVQELIGSNRVDERNPISTSIEKQRTMAQKSYETLAHIDAILQESNVSDKSILLTKLLNREDFDINFQIPSTSCLKYDRPHLLGNTALHFLIDHRQLEIFNKFVERGADVTLKNDAGETVLHRALNRSCRSGKKYWELKGKLEHPFVDSILAAQLSSRNTANPSDANGVSHFHGAVMTNNVEAVEFFLNYRSVLVGQTIDGNSKIFPGYTPLHFAARYSALDAAKLLLRRGADVNCKDAQGATPLHLLIERNVELMDWMPTEKRQLVESEYEANEKLIVLLSSKTEAFSDLHVACTIRNASLVKLLLDRGSDLNGSVSLYSRYWPGYTALHFAAHFSFETVELLIERGANVLAKDGRGDTPLDICLQRHTPRDVHSIVASLPKLKNIVMSDGKTALADFVLAMRDNETLDEFVKGMDAGINVSIPLDSPVWPGYTPLHLAVVAAKKVNSIVDLCLDVGPESIGIGRYTDEEDELSLERIKLCLKLNANVNAQDFYNASPIHLSFRSHKPHIAHLLLRSLREEAVSNLTDSGGLSYLHIACALNSQDSVEQLLQAGANVRSSLKSEICYTASVDPEDPASTYRPRRIPELSTCLHIAAREDNASIAKLLLEHGADVHARDANGYTPLHCLIGSKRPKDWPPVLAEHLANLENSTTSSGLSHLHVACFVGGWRPVYGLLRQSIADVEATIDPASSDPLLASYLGYRPLHFAVANSDCYDVADKLMENGADLFRRSANGVSPLHLLRESCRFRHYGRSNFRDVVVFGMLQGNDKLMKMFELKTGVTKLHIASASGDFELVGKLLRKRRQDVHRVSFADSPIWPHCTPLHVALDVPVCSFGTEGRKVLALLLEAGADVTLTNGEGLTPIHQLHHRSFHQGCDVEMWQLFYRIMDPEQNRTCPSGLSLLHIACLHGQSYAEEFAKCAEDRAIDHFADRHAGFSPLHCAVMGSRSGSSVDSLLKRGADVRRVDRSGDTALHVAARERGGGDDLEKLIRAGGDIKAENVFGQTPLDLLVMSGRLNSELSTLCSKYGFNAQHFSAPDAAGCNAIHRMIRACYNVAIHEYRFTIHQLWKLGCDVDLEDNQGKTALYYAAILGQEEAVGALLACGSDPNLLDGNGASVFSHFVNCSAELNLRSDQLVNIITHFSDSLRAMQLVGIYIHPVNVEALQKANSIIKADPPPRYARVNMLSDDVLTKDIEVLSTVKFGETPMFLNEILRQNTIIRYSRMAEEKRRAIDELFRENVEILDEFSPTTIGILLLQYKKAMARENLCEKATIAFNSLTKHIVPALCVDLIMGFLENHELNCLMKAADCNI